MPIARTALFALLILCATPSFGDELTAEKRADVERLLQMTGALSVGKQMSSAVVQQMTEVLRKARPDIPQGVLDVLPEEVDAVIDDNMGAFKDLTHEVPGQVRWRCRSPDSMSSQ